MPSGFRAACGITCVPHVCGTWASYSPVEDEVSEGGGLRGALVPGGAPSLLGCCFSAAGSVGATAWNVQFSKDRLYLVDVINTWKKCQVGPSHKNLWFTLWKSS